MSEHDMVHKLEQKFPFLTHIVLDEVEGNGTHVFSCIDIDKESELRVDREGWVSTRVKTKKYWDVLGQIH